MYIYPGFTVAASILPLVEDTIPDQFREPMEVLSTQLTPVFVDVYIYPGFTVAASILPSNDDVILFQFRDPADVLCTNISPIK